MTQTIENTALALFQLYGGKNVSIDDIAKRMNVSKRTIYEKYATKEKLVVASLSAFFKKIRTGISKIEATKLNPVLMIVELNAFIVRETNPIRPVFLQSIKKYYPVASSDFDRFQKKVIDETFLPLYNKAQRDGYIRSDVNIQLLLELYEKNFEDFFSGNASREKPRNYNALFRHIIINNTRGLLTKESYYILDNEIKILP